MPAPTNASANGARPERAPVNGNDVVVVATGGFVEPSGPVVVVVVVEITVDGEILMLVVVDFGVNSNVVSVVELVLELVLVLDDDSAQPRQRDDEPAPCAAPNLPLPLGPRGQHVRSRD